MIWAAAISSRSPATNITQLQAIAVRATSEEEALGRALIAARNHFKAAEGWDNPVVVVNIVPETWVKAEAETLK
jgi:hypothetical protein